MLSVAKYLILTTKGHSLYMTVGRDVMLTGPGSAPQGRTFSVIKKPSNCSAANIPNAIAAPK